MVHYALPLHCLFLIVITILCVFGYDYTFSEGLTSKSAQIFLFNSRAVGIRNFKLCNEFC